MKEYYSKLDWWIGIGLVGSLLFCLALGLYLWGEDTLGSVICIGIGLFMSALILLLGIPCKYTLHDEYLIVQSGIVKYMIKYADITDITKSSNPLSAPAFSLKRIKIKHKKGFILISPKNRDQFITDITARLL